MLTESPFAEPVTVAWGGNTLEANYPHAWMPFERWAYDLLTSLAVLESQNLEDYGTYLVLGHLQYQSVEVEVGDLATDGTRQPVGDTLMPPVNDGSESSATIPE